MCLRGPRDKIMGMWKLYEYSDNQKSEELNEISVILYKRYTYKTLKR